MHPSHRQRTRRTPGAFNALWVAVLVLSLGLFGSGAVYQESDQSSAAGFSGAFDPLIGAPSSTELKTLPNWLRQSAEGSDDGEAQADEKNDLFNDDEHLSRLISGYSPPIIPASRCQSAHSPRAPPLV